jgi:hypothetical protein
MHHSFAYRAARAEWQEKSPLGSRSRRGASSNINDKLPIRYLLQHSPPQAQPAQLQSSQTPCSHLPAAQPQSSH